MDVLFSIYRDFWKIFLPALTVFHTATATSTIWTEWWTYSGISGPKFWGVHNPDWRICAKGKYQSPIDVNPKHLVYDPYMSQLNISKHKVNAMFRNNGHDVSIIINATEQFIISGGPLSYTYTLFEIVIHFGSDEFIGSEHTIGGKPFPLEVQFYAYNSETNENISQARHTPHGVTAISVLAQVSYDDNAILDKIIQAALKVKQKDMTEVLKDFYPSQILPSTQTFLTYEGSLTKPGCMETVTWILLNKPIQISYNQLKSLRSLTNHDGSGNYLMENNFRMTMPSNGRLIRTNIKSKAKAEDCYGLKLTSYEVNTKFQEDDS